MTASISSTKLVVLSAWISRLVGAFATIYSLRVLSNTLAFQEYATFVVMVGLAGWFALCDFGLGYAVQNAVTNRLSSGSSGAGDVLSAYVMVLLTTCAVVLAIFVFKGPIAGLLFAKIAATQPASGADTFFRSALLFTVGASAAISTKILYGKQRGYVANTVAAASSAIGAWLLTIGLSSADDRVTYAVVALYGPNALVCCGLAAWQIARALHEKPQLPYSTFSGLARASRGFFVFNLLGAAALQIDYLVMSQKVTPMEIIQYYSLAKFFSFIAFFNQAILFAAWPTMTARFSAGALPEIRAQLKRLVLWSGTVTLGATAVILLAKDHLAMFVTPGTPITFRGWVIVGFGAVALIRCLTDPFAIFLQSIGRLTPLIWCATAQALVSASLQWALSESLSIEGILLALVLSFVITSAWVLPLSAQKILAPRTRATGP
ncbi:MAG: MATE family efflux transporter [Pseudomonadota bacterium]